MILLKDWKELEKTQGFIQVQINQCESDINTAGQMYVYSLDISISTFITFLCSQFSERASLAQLDLAKIPGTCF